jgi:hypothetical protein
MTGSETVIQQMKEIHSSELTEKYWEVKEALEQEFGLGWTLREIAKAKKIIKQGSSAKTKGTIARRVHELFTQSEKEVKKAKPGYIENRQVTPEQYALYCKALFFVAGVQLQKEL